MGSLWGTITGADRKNASSEQLKRQREKEAAEAAAASKAEAEAAAQRAAEAKVKQSTFAKGGRIDGIAKKGKTRGRYI